MNAVEIEDTVSRLAELPSDPEVVPYVFLEKLSKLYTKMTAVTPAAKNARK